MLHVTQVLPFLTHADADVRELACRYFAQLGDASPTETADELWKAIDQYGDFPTEFETKERHRFLGALRGIAISESTVIRVIQLLGQWNSDPNDVNALNEFFLVMPIQMLQQHKAVVLPLLTSGYRRNVEHRLSLAELTAEQIWAQLTELGERADETEDFDPADAHAMVEALARHQETSVPLAMGVLENPQERWRLEIWSCELLGQLRHAPAIDLLVQKMAEEDADYLRQAAADALGRMPAEAVVSRLEAAYPSDDPFYRTAVADVLGHVKDPLAEAALLRLLPTEDSVTGLTGIAIALCELLTTDGLEQLRQLVIADRYDTQIADIKELVVTVAKMTGFALPEIVEWKQQLADPVYKEQLRDKFLSSFGLDKKMIEQFRSYLAGHPIEEEPEEHVEPVPRSLAKPSTIRRTEPKIGRNDPCFCGSGKKFKKCCGK